MTPEEQRLAIARACGWRIYKSNGITYYERPGGNVYNHALCVEDLPDYLNDLNAIHEAEKILMTDPNLMNKYQNYELVKFVSSTNSNWLCRATAAQRAEAFLKTLGLWSK